MRENQGAPLPEGADPALHDLYRRWSEHTDGIRLPTAAEIDLEDLLHRYAGTALIRIGRYPNGKPRYLYERVGAGHVRVVGRDLEGYWLDEVVPVEHIRQYERVYEQAVADRHPHYWMRLNSLVGTNTMTFERLVVPTAEDGRNVDALVGVWVWIGST